MKRAEAMFFRLTPPIATHTSLVAMPLSRCLFISFASVTALVCAFPETHAAETDGDAFFSKEVLPILQGKCFKCHGGGSEIEGALQLTSREYVLEGGDSGSAVDLDSPEESLLLSAINYEDYEMPPTGKLPQKQIEVLTRWVKMGMPYPDGIVKIDENAHHGPPKVNDENRKFWSFQPIEKPKPPKVQQSDWIASPIDRFVLARLEAEGLKPNLPAEPSELVRRVYYDLTGLPPSPKEAERWATRIEKDPAAFETLVDELLASPHYGERWGRHWLDLVRYAETNSYERDDAKPEVWRYRDYVIRSLNEDKPYDQFVREQIAGDEFAQPTPDSIIATGYYRLGRWDDEPVDAEQAWYDDMDDVVATTSQVFLGLTMNCARCHDHKLDPIPQEDYYRFLAFFSNVERYGGPNRKRDVNRWSLTEINTPEFRELHEAKVKAHREELADVAGKIAAIEEAAMAWLLPVEKEDFQYDSNRPDVLRKHVPQDISEAKLNEYVTLRGRRDALKANPPASLGRALCVKESGSKPRSMNLLLRGSPKAKDKEVLPGFPQILGFDDPEIERPEKSRSTHRRTALANWLTNERNPLTARVMANRIWQYHFGRGLVRSSNDLGFQGTPPTHPELLDWLAADFMAEGWSMKRMHKQIMLSSTYQQSSRARKDALAKDPENNLFWRFDMRRLSAEEVRDSILAANGQLNLKMGGPSIFPVIPKEVLAGQSRPGHGWNVSAPPDRVRRSVYIHVKRSLAVPLLENHDMADVDQTCPVRFNTTVPSQALGLLNSQFMNEQAAAFANYVREEAGDDTADKVALTLKRVTQREPAETEVRRGVDLINALRNDHEMSDDQALKYFCLMALNLNEFVYLD